VNLATSQELFGFAGNQELETRKRTNRRPARQGAGRSRGLSKNQDAPRPRRALDLPFWLTRPFYNRKSSAFNPFLNRAAFRGLRKAGADLKRSGGPGEAGRGPGEVRRASGRVFAD
jgi:hypothetical protein